MMPLWRRARELLVDTVYPRTCAGCGMRGPWLCELCEISVPALDQGICDRCGYPGAGTCRACRHLDAAIVKARSAFPYTGWVASAIRTYKYADEFDRGNDLAGRMLPALASLGPVDVVVPVPLHPHKRSMRGYNQSELLARHTATALGVPIAEGLVRTRDTTPQVTLGREERRTNVEDAFAIHPSWAPPSGLRVLLIDDVRTTGATLSACARSLLAIQPASVSVATLAIDVPRRELAAWLDSIAFRSGTP